jgi:hypothetical protein
MCNRKEGKSCAPLDGGLVLGMVNRDMDALSREVVRVAVIVFDSDYDRTMALDPNLCLALNRWPSFRHLFLVHPSPVHDAS